MKLADEDLRSGVLWTGKGVSQVREALAKLGAGRTVEGEWDEVD